MRIQILSIFIALNSTLLLALEPLVSSDSQVIKPLHSGSVFRRGGRAKAPQKRVLTDAAEAEKIMGDPAWTAMSCGANGCEYERKSPSGTILETVLIPNKLKKHAEPVQAKLKSEYPELNTIEDFNRAVKEATDAGLKCLIVKFGAPNDGCISCQRLDKMFDNPESKKAFTERKIGIYVTDVGRNEKDSHGELASFLGSKSTGESFVEGKQRKTLNVPVVIEVKLDGKGGYSSKPIIDGRWGGADADENPGRAKKEREKFLGKVCDGDTAAPAVIAKTTGGSISVPKGTVAPAAPAAAPNLRAVHSKAELEQLLKNEKRHVMVLYSSMTSCPPCQQMAPLIKRFKDAHKGDFAIYYVDGTEAMSGNPPQGTSELLQLHQVARFPQAVIYLPTSRTADKWLQIDGEVAGLRKYFNDGISAQDQAAAARETGEIAAKQQANGGRPITTDSSVNGHPAVNAIYSLSH